MWTLWVWEFQDSWNAKLQGYSIRRGSVVACSPNVSHMIDDVCPAVDQDHNGIASVRVLPWGNTCHEEHLPLEL